MNILKKIWRKRLSQEEQMRLQFRDAFDDSIKSKAVRSYLTGDSFSDGMIVYAAIANTYKCIKENRQFQAISVACLSQHGFDPSSILEDELHRAMRKYCGIEQQSNSTGFVFSDLDRSLSLRDSVDDVMKADSHVSKGGSLSEKNDIEFSPDGTVLEKVKSCSGHYSIPEGVTTIADGAFMGITSLYSITFPHSLKRIEENAFCSCSGLQTINGGDSIEYIGAWAFSWCLNLKSFYIPKTVTIIDSNPFAFTFSGKPVDITSESLRFPVVDGFLIDSVEGKAISYNGKESIVVIPNTVSCLGDSCFRGADHVHKLVIPKTVTICENNPIPMSGIREIESWSNQIVVRGFMLISGSTIHAYFGNEDSVEIPEGITSLADCSFDCIDDLNKVKLPATIDDVGDEPFRGCDNLKYVFVPNGHLLRIKSLFPEDFEVKLLGY